MTSLIGFNVLAGADYNREELLYYIESLNSAATVIMDNSELATTLQALRPNALVIYRRWPDDNVHKKYPDPVAWVDTMVSYVPDKRILLYAGNEPEVSEEHVAWTIKAMRYASFLGRRLVVGNYGMGGPEDEEWYGVLQPLLEELAILKEHVLGLHEYADFHNYRYVGKDHKPNPNPPPEYRDVNFDPLTGNNWLIGRFTRIHDVCDSFDLKHPNIIITEWGFDSLAEQFHGWLAGAKVPEAEYARQLIEMVELVYKKYPNILGLCIFCWQTMYGKWNTFNVNGADLLLTILRNYAQDTEEMETIKAKIIVTANTNRRDAPAGKLIPGQMLEGTYIGLVSPEPTLYNYQGVPYLWHYFQTETESWWAATAIVDKEAWVTIEPIPDDVEPPAPPPTPIPETELIEVYEMLQEMARLYKDLMQVIENQAALAKNYTQEFIEDVQDIINNLEEN